MNETANANIFTGAQPVAANFDVLIIGAGISGLCSAVRLQQECPWASFAVLEAMESHGGTWLSNKFPGVRSDSDLFTYGYSFKPWEGAPIARGEPILEYMRETISEHDLQDRIRYGHRVLRAEWSSADAHWIVTVEIGGETTAIYTANFLWMCQGYYRHREGHSPQWPGIDHFKGDILHPQRWPQNYDYSGKRVIVIGSGATAATIVPALAEKAERIVQIQRSPSYYFPSPNEYPLATQLRQLDIPREWIHEIVRQQLLKEHNDWVRHSLDNPDVATEEMLGSVREALGGTIPDDFIPKYKPWRQRVCMIPDNDYFGAFTSGKASITTGEIEQFTENGVRLKSGEEIEADLIVTATGFNVNVFGDMEIVKDGEPLPMSDTVTYRGLMFTETPNFVWVAGYFRSAAYTLRAELVADLMGKLLNLMHDRHYATVVPKLREEDKGMNLLPYMATEEFAPGYTSRAADILPRSGDHDPWRHSQDYWADRADFEALDFSKEPLVFEAAQQAAALELASGT